VKIQARTPVVDDHGVLYVSTLKGTLYAVTDVGTIIWRFSTGARVSGLAVTKKRDLLAVTSGGLFCVRGGRLRWKFQTNGNGGAPPIHDQTGTIYVGQGSQFYGITNSGKELWRLSLPGYVATSPSMDRSGRIYVAGVDRLYCLSDIDKKD